MKRAMVHSMSVALLFWAPWLAGTGCGSEPTESQRLAEEIVRSAGVQAGLCVHLNSGNGELTAALAGSGDFLVHGLAPDRTSLEEARRYVDQQGIYGRVSVDRCPFDRLPYADDLVNLLVVHDLPKALAKGLSVAEVMRVLCPDGVAYLGAGGESGDALRNRLAAAGIRDVEIIARLGVWARVRKPRPAEMDDWTHWRYGPDGNAVSGDTRVGEPRHLRWIVGPTWSRSHGLPGSLKAMVSSGGRIFFVYDEAPTSVEGPWRLALVARDAYNGLLLWKRPMVSAYTSGSLKGTPYRFKKQTLVAAGDRVYAVLEPNGRLVALDVATGRVARTYRQAASPDQVIHVRGILILREKEAIRALEAATGNVLWRHDESAYGDVVVGGGEVFFQGPWGTLVCLDAVTGKEKWKRVINTPGVEGSITKRRLHLCLHHKDLLVLGEGYAGEATYGFSATDGAHLWRYAYHPVYRTTDVYAVGGLVWVHVKEGKDPTRWVSIGLDPATGEERKRVPWPAEYAERTGHHRCYVNRATARYFLLGSRNIDLVDWRAGRTKDVSVARGDCAFGILPANGLIYVPPHPCQCDHRIQVRGFLALAPANEAADEVPASQPGPLAKGPAFGATPQPAAADDDWPTYRRDARRSGSTAALVPPDLKPLWQTQIGAPPSSPTVAAGRVFVAAADQHRVLALDAETGARQWDFIAGGGVDSPPTFYLGLVLFGCRDGWVYCLRAADGQLVWRLRAAPADRRIVAFGQLESPWPIHGSVLVKEGVACVAVGRAANMDGLSVVAVKPFTGEVVWRKQSAGVSDVLATDERDRYVHLRRNVFSPTTGETPRYAYAAGRPVWSGTGFLDPSWPSRARWRFWYTTAEILVYDSDHTYGVWAFYQGVKNARTKPGNNEYTLFCRKRAGRKEEPVWSVKVPVRMTALALAGKTLFAAGPPDVAEPDDPWAAFDGRKGGELWAVSTADGAKLAARTLAAPPVYDGLAAAGGRLYLSTQAGTVLCFGRK